MRKSILGLAMLMFTMHAHPYDGLSDGRVLAIRIQSYRILIVQQNATDPGSCGDSSYLILPQSDSVSHKNMYAALLSAYATQSAVRLALTGCSEAFPVIEQVWLR